MSNKRTLTVRHLETGEVGTVLDVTGKSEREVDKLWNGLVRRIDVDNWGIYDSQDEV